MFARSRAILFSYFLIHRILDRHGNFPRTFPKRRFAFHNFQETRAATGKRIMRSESEPRKKNVNRK